MCNFFHDLYWIISVCETCARHKISFYRNTESASRAKSQSFSWNYFMIYINIFHRRCATPKTQRYSEYYYSTKRAKSPYGDWQLMGLYWEKGEIGVFRIMILPFMEKQMHLEMQGDNYLIRIRSWLRP